MASHQLAIAKASLSAGLLRPDPTSVPRDDITAFHSALDRALSHCSSANIQACKSWLLRHVVSSSNRVGVWAKYLAALSGSFAAEEGAPATSAKRKRLHIMYLLNDVFHHTKYHMGSRAAFSTVSGSLQPYIVELLGYAASYDREKNPKHHRRLDDLLDIWEANEYYGSDYVGKLREVVKTSALSGPVKASIDVETSNLDATNKPSGKDVPFVMPATHGDPSTPFYDLPAGNLIPHIIPNSTIPLRPDTVKPLQFLAGPADQKLVTAVKAFLKDVDRIYESTQPEPQDGEMVDIDDLGEVVIREDKSGDVLDGETYYGWNVRASSRSRSRSRSLTPRKRRRYSNSVASDDSRSSRSRSRSQTPPRRASGRKYDSRSRSRSRPSQSYSPRRPSPPRAHPPTHHPPPNPYGPGHAPPAPAYPPHHQHHPPPPPPHYPMHFAGGPPGGPPFPPPGMFPQGVPPPPPPQNYQGSWPPPPPPSMQNCGPAPGMNTSHFPPPYQAQGGQYPSMHRGPGLGPSQQMPPGSYHFPPPHSGGQGQGQGQGPGQGQGQGISGPWPK
ncbi:hypothetical protein P170DRAFT_453490 [Aspergillus steynii IBT 23096]|uniref:CID domain-containing protein n=1 Tax=Aspergillus steynii IBT 23096 TaxID=1392250 RepID=A0A2I2GGB3_9EURO|nr:uncharacterized protein P170DRAFT_453490 [Aspergillus steynii IBT 23096]PLB51916.1 hypothetical protein P170DRAFT_453490 [Aspergillus steynii IBT 23096]